MEKKNGTKNNSKQNTIGITMLMQLLALYLQQQIELTAYELESVREWNSRNEKGETNEDGNCIGKFDEDISCFDEDFRKEWL